jgi:hypothetical protein
MFNVHSAIPRFHLMATCLWLSTHTSLPFMRLAGKKNRQFRWLHLHGDVFGTDDRGARGMQLLSVDCFALWSQIEQALP